MRLSDGVEYGLHCGVLLAFAGPDGALPAARLAEYHGIPAAYLAKHLQAMSRAGLLESVQGPKGGYRLARPATEITVLVGVEAVYGVAPAGRGGVIRGGGPAARPAREYRGLCGIHAVMNRADEAWRAELRGVTLADIAVGVMEGAPPKSIEIGAKWMSEAVR
jgi:Rrf2 family protein